MPIAISPRVLLGPWMSGFALDVHTASSTFLRNDALGHARFNTVRTPMGELVYRLKYRRDNAAVQPIVDAVAGFLWSWKPSVDAIVTVPPSNNARRKQPVVGVAERLSQVTGLPLCDGCVRKVKTTGQMKDVDEWRRSEILADAFVVDPRTIAKRRLLLFDDLCDSGATAQAITRALLNPGGAQAVSLLTLTQVR